MAGNPNECCGAAIALSIRFVMALSLFAARALVVHYLNGRTLPDPLHDFVVQAVESRLINGAKPVLDAKLCEQIDSQAAELRPQRAGVRSHLS